MRLAFMRLHGRPFHHGGGYHFCLWARTRMIPVIVSGKKLTVDERNEQRRLNHILSSSQDLLEQCRRKRAQVEQTCAVHRRILDTKLDDGGNGRKPKKKKNKKKKKEATSPVKVALDDKFVCRSTILELMQEEVQWEQDLHVKIERTVDASKKAKLLHKLDKQHDAYNERLLKMI